MFQGEYEPKPIQRECNCVDCVHTPAAVLSLSQAEETSPMLEKRTTLMLMDAHRIEARMTAPAGFLWLMQQRLQHGDADSPAHLLSFLALVQLTHAGPANLQVRPCLLDNPAICKGVANSISHVQQHLQGATQSCNERRLVWPLQSWCAGQAFFYVTGNELKTLGFVQALAGQLPVVVPTLLLSLGELHLRRNTLPVCMLLLNPKP